MASSRGDPPRPQEIGYAKKSRDPSPPNKPPRQLALALALGDLRPPHHSQGAVRGGSLNLKRISTCPLGGAKTAARGEETEHVPNHQE